MRQLLQLSVLILSGQLGYGILFGQTDVRAVFVNRLVDSQLNHYTYAYAPSIIYENNTFHMFYCSNPPPGIGGTDSIRYTWSSDGRIWRSPKVMLYAVQDESGDDGGACDPSVVKFDAGDGPYYYLFYSGNVGGTEQTVMYVSRSKNIDGPYAKWSKSGVWIEQSPHPQRIIEPRNPTYRSYGAGEQTVVEKDGQLCSWYSDYSLGNPYGAVFFACTKDPKEWPVAVQTNVIDGSVDVKYDPEFDQFVMFGISNQFSPSSALTRRTSRDGKTWTTAETLTNSTTFPGYAHNVGVSGDPQGHVIANRYLVAYGAPYDLSSDLPSAHWDIFGTALNPAGQVWNEIPWGWQWSGMPDNAILALGDYDGDGKTDRAFVDPSTNGWFIIGSKDGKGAGVGGQWPWIWPGAGSGYRLALGDYDGDGKTDRAIVYPDKNAWFIIGSKDGNGAGVGGQWPWIWPGAGSGYLLALGDYDGDGKTDRAIVYPDKNAWFIIGSKDGNGAGVGGQWPWIWPGAPSGYLLALGDYDGDGKTDRAIVYPDSNKWFIIGSKDGNGAGVGGQWPWIWPGAPSGYLLALGDYDGDGKTDLAIVYPNTNAWFIIGSKDGNGAGVGGQWPWIWPDAPSQYELAIGDYDGDGKIDKAIFDRANKRFYVVGSMPFRIY